MKKLNKIIGALLGAVMLLTQSAVAVMANSEPNYLQFPYFDDFDNCDFSLTAQTGDKTHDVAPNITSGELPEAYDGTTITRALSANNCGTIAIYDDGIEKMVKSTRNYSSSLNFDIGEFEPGLLTNQFTMEMRIKFDDVAQTNTPRIYGQIAKKDYSGTSGTNAEDTIKLFFVVQGSIRIPTNSSATGSQLLTDPESGATFVMTPNQWYTLRCSYDFSKSSNNLTLELMGRRGDGSDIEISKTTTLSLEKEYNSEDLTRFRLSHFGADPGANNQSVAYYKDISFYTDVERTMSLPFEDNFESYSPFEAKAQLLGNRVDYPPIMNYGKLPGSYGNSSLTASLSDSNRGIIKLAEESNFNKYIQIQRYNADSGRNNIDIGPFEQGVLTENKISVSFRAKFGEKGDTNFPGVMVLLSQTGSSNNADNSIPLMYFYPDRVLVFNGPLNTLKGIKDTSSAIKLRDSSAKQRIVAGEWYDFDLEIDYSQQTMSVRMQGEAADTAVYEMTINTPASCPSNEFDPKNITTFRLRADERGGGDNPITVGFDDINLKIIPTFKIASDINGQTDVSPTGIQNINITFPQIKADASTVANAGISISPETGNVALKDISEEGFTIDLSNSGVLRENTEYEISIDGITDESGNELTGNVIKFTTGGIDKYIMYNETLCFTNNGEEINKLIPGEAQFTMEAGNYSDEPITFAMGLYKKDSENYDIMTDYVEQNVAPDGKSLIRQSFNIPSLGQYYIKGYFLSSPVTSFAQNFVFDENGMKFTDRSDTVYKKVSYSGENVIASENEEAIGNICDGDFSSYWESGDDGYIIVDMGEQMDIDFIQLAFYQSEDEAVNYCYTVSTSLDGMNFAYAAEGNTLNRENLKFIQKSFNRVSARYIKVSKTNPCSENLRLSWVGLYRAADNQYWSF